MYEAGSFLGNFTRKFGDMIIIGVVIFFLLKLGGRSDTMQEIISHVNLELEGVSILVECTEEELLEINASGLYRFYDGLIRVYSRPDVYMNYISSPDLVRQAQNNFERTSQALPFCGRTYHIVRNIKYRLRADYFVATCVSLDDYYSCQEAPKTTDDYESMLQLNAVVGLMRITLGDIPVQQSFIGLPQSKNEIMDVYPQYSGYTGTDIWSANWNTDQVNTPTVAPPE